MAPVTGTVSIEGKNIIISYEEREEEEYVVPFTASIRIEKGAHVKAGDQLTEGHVNPQDILRIKGREAAQRYRRGSAACRQCPIRPVCGGCLAVTHGFGHNIFVERDPYCFIERLQNPSP